MRGKIIVATNNTNKFREIKLLLSDLNVDLLYLKDFPDIPDIIEDGLTLEENAIKKAVTAGKHTGLISLGEDTGLEIYALNGKPGVYSARFAGPNCSYQDNNRKVLELMKNIPFNQRKAKFRCVIAINIPEKNKILTCEGSIDGYITEEERGNSGFGYDPIFFVPEYNRTFAQMDIKTKNIISHRYKAINECKKILKDILNNRNI